MLQKVAFICVHNSCRSQLAEALGRALCSDVFESFSAGTEVKDRINPDAVRVLKEERGIDMEAEQHPKLIGDLPDIDIAIKMGCEVACPYLASSHEEDWGLQDPSGGSDEVFRETIRLIEEKLLDLAKRIRTGNL